MSNQEPKQPEAAMRGWYLSAGLKRIAAERDRQVHAEGFDFAHDDAHTDESLAMAAACYASPYLIYRIEHDEATGDERVVDAWPESFSEDWDKRELHDRVRQLEIAGALIAAELDRLLRAGAAVEPLE